MIQARANYEAKYETSLNSVLPDGWFWRWHWRFNIGKSVRLKGEARVVNLEEAEKDMQVMRDAILAGGYQMQNMDETALLYRFIPNRTYAVQGGDQRQAGKGTKMMLAKERLTLVLCGNSLACIILVPFVACLCL